MERIRQKRNNYIVQSSLKKKSDRRRLESGRNTRSRGVTMFKTVQYTFGRNTASENDVWQGLICRISIDSPHRVRTEWHASYAGTLVKFAENAVFVLLRLSWYYSSRISWVVVYRVLEKTLFTVYDYCYLDYSRENISQPRLYDIYLIGLKTLFILFWNNNRTKDV